MDSTPDVCDHLTSTPDTICARWQEEEGLDGKVVELANPTNFTYRELMDFVYDVSFCWSCGLWFAV